MRASGSGLASASAVGARVSEVGGRGSLITDPIDVRGKNSLYTESRTDTCISTSVRTRFGPSFPQG